MKKIFLALITTILPFILIGQPTEEVKKILAADGVSSDLFGISVDISGDFAIVGASFNDGLGWENSGAAYIFQKDAGGENNWQQIKKLVALDASADDNFGISVAIDGNVAVVGARYNDANGNTDAGAAYIFYKDEEGTNNWGLRKKITPYSAHAYDQFGTSVDISGNTIIVGANRKDYSGLKYGAAYIFDKDEGGTDNWGEVKAFFSVNPDNGDNFGWSVAIDGDNAIVGAKFDNEFGDDAGSATIYSRNQGGANNWGSVSLVGGDDIMAGDEFGFDVAISGETAVVGAHKHTISGGTDGEGAVYVFEKDAGGTNNWGQTQKLTDPNPYLDEWFGYGVAINGSTILAGAEQDRFNTVRYGAAHIFQHDGSSWVYADSVRANDGASYDRFGGAVAYDGQFALISSRYDDDKGTSSGSAYVFGPPAPEITSQPTGLSDLCEGSTYQLSVTGNFIEQYQWQQSTDGGNNFLDISSSDVFSGTEAADLNILFSTEMHNYQYRCIVSNARDSETSDAVNLEKDATQPVLSVQDVNIELDTDGNASLNAPSVVASASDNCGIVDTTISQTVFSCEHIGENIVDVTVTDAAGNFMTDQVTVTVEDNTAPNFTANDIILQLNESGTAQIDKEAVFSNVYDNCGVTDSIITKTHFDCNDVGINTVTAYLYDGVNYSPSQEFTVTVEDNIAPQISVENITVFLDATGNASITADEIINSASDNCEVADTVVTQSVFDCSNIGENNISVIITDVNGNETIETVVVTIEDDEIPTLTTQDFTLELNENGEAILKNADVVLSASDNCQLDTTLMQNHFTCADLGSNLIDVSVTDNGNNTITKQALVTVVDILAPQITVQDITVELDGSNTATINPEMVLLSASDNCSVAETSLSQSTFTTTDVGQLTVDVTTTDESNNSTTVPIVVTILENEPPQLVTQPINLYLDEYGSATIHAVDVIESVSDNHQLADTTLNQNTFSCNDVGEIIIDVTATDINGNTSVEEALIIVADTLAPIPDVTNLPDLTGECSVTIDETHTATDNCGGVITAITDNPLEYIEQGSYVVEWRYTDYYENTTIQTQNIIIEDNTPPTLSCVGSQEVTADENGYYTVQETEFDPTEADDNCGIASIVNDFNNTETLAGEQIPEGTTNVVWTITDNAGNTNSCNIELVVTASETSIARLQQAGINLYPNPTSHSLTVELGENKVQHLTLTDLTGRVILTKENPNPTETLDVSSLGNGMYLLNIKTEDKVISTRVVKQ
ncbi:MAG: T9SS type A sorting domain-containing protein [Bacteroidales bacterium]